jgi:uncharacterized membrane protein
MMMTPLSKRLVIALVVSVALNLLLAGIFVGGAIQRSRVRAARPHVTLHGGDGRNRDDERGGDGRRRFDGTRERARRGGPFGGLLASHRDEMLARRDATLAARNGVREALTHEPFDPAALDRALAALRQETATTQTLLHQAIADSARSGDAAARAKLAQGFERAGAGPL